MKILGILLFALFALAGDGDFLVKARFDFSNCLVDKTRGEQRAFDESISLCQKDLEKKKEYKNVKPDLELVSRGENTITVKIKTIFEKAEKKNKITKTESSQIMSAFNIQPDDRFCRNCGSMHNEAPIKVLQEQAKIILGYDKDCHLGPGQRRTYNFLRGNGDKCEWECLAGFKQIGDQCVSACGVNEAYAYNRCIKCDDLNKKLKNKFKTKYTSAYKVIAVPDENLHCRDQFGCSMENQRYSFAQKQCVYSCHPGFEVDEVKEFGGDLNPCSRTNDYCEQNKNVLLSAPFTYPPQEILNLVPGCPVDAVLNKMKIDYLTDVDRVYNNCLENQARGRLNEFGWPFFKTWADFKNGCDQLMSGVGSDIGITDEMYGILGRVEWYYPNPYSLDP